MIINDLKNKDYAFFFFFYQFQKGLKNIRWVETQPTWNIKFFGENNNKSNARDTNFFLQTSNILSGY